MAAIISGSADSTFSNGININSGKFTVDAATGAVTSAAGMTLAGAVSGITTLGAGNLNVTATTVPTNGIYLPAANTIGFAINSVYKMRIDPSGDIVHLTDNGGLFFNGTRNAIVGSNAADTVTIATANATRAVFSSTGLSVTGTLSAGVIRASNTNTLGWATHGGFESTADGAVQLYNEARNAFGTLKTGALTTDGGLQTFGANDSAGAGYRLVRVPNA